jgi:hypothetical protein
MIFAPTTSSGRSHRDFASCFAGRMPALPAAWLVAAVAHPQALAFLSFSSIV